MIVLVHVTRELTWILMTSLLAIIHLSTDSPLTDADLDQWHRHARSLLTMCHVWLMLMTRLTTRVLWARMRQQPAADGQRHARLHLIRRWSGSWHVPAQNVLPTSFLLLTMPHFHVVVPTSVMLRASMMLSLPPTQMLHVMRQFCLKTLYVDQTVHRDHLHHRGLSARHTLNVLQMRMSISWLCRQTSWTLVFVIVWLKAQLLLLLLLSVLLIVMQLTIDIIIKYVAVDSHWWVSQIRRLVSATDDDPSRRFTSHIHSVFSCCLLLFVLDCWYCSRVLHGDKISSTSRSRSPSPSPQAPFPSSPRPHKLVSAVCFFHCKI